MEMTYLVVKETYGDFDIRQEVVVAASENESMVDIVVSAFNDSRTKQDLNNEVSFFKRSVKTL